MAHQRPRSNLDTNHDKQMEEDKQMDATVIDDGPAEVIEEVKAFVA